MKDKEDKDIVQRIAQGDAKAFRNFFRLHYPQVYAFAFSFVKNGMDADDIAQTVFISLWQRREFLTSVVNADAYLFRMTRNRVFNFFVANDRMPQQLSIDSARDSGGDANPQEILMAKDTKLLVDMIVEGMPAQRRKVYRMSREEGLSNEEIAHKLGLEKKTVENHLNNALKEIRKALIIYFMLMFWV